MYAHRGKTKNGSTRRTITTDINSTAVRKRGPCKTFKFNSLQLATFIRESEANFPLEEILTVERRTVTVHAICACQVVRRAFFLLHCSNTLEHASEVNCILLAYSVKSALGECGRGWGRGVEPISHLFDSVRLRRLCTL